MLFVGIVLAVWAGHRRLLRAGGYRFGRYWHQAWLRMRSAWAAMAPSRYAWPGWDRRGQGLGARDPSKNPAAALTR